MTVVPLSEAKDKLSALVEQAETTHEIVTITRHGRPAAVLMAAADLESLHETLFWFPCGKLLTNAHLVLVSPLLQRRSSLNRRLNNAVCRT